MARGKSVLKFLLESSESALFAGIEIHNKPHISYRYPTAVILIVNAWELLLKAYIYRYIGKDGIYEKGDNKSHTVSFTSALEKVANDITKNKGDTSFLSVKQNLYLLDKCRCDSIHYFGKEPDAPAFMLISKSVLNYSDFILKYFDKDLTKSDNLIILPIGFKRPFDPVQFLKQENVKGTNPLSNEIIEITRELNRENIQDSVVVGINICAVSQKKCTNADIIAAIDQENGEVELTKKYRLTNDSNAPAVSIEKIGYELTYRQFQQELKKRMPNIKFDRDFNAKMKEIKQNNKLCYVNYLDRINKTGTNKCYYQKSAVEVMIKMYETKS
jgi:hypothetical protein